MPTATVQRPVGVIEAECIYTLGEIKSRLGLGRHAMRTAKKKGLVHRRIGRKVYILGRDVINYVQNTSVVES